MEGEEKKNRLQHLLMAMSQSIRHNNNNSRDIHIGIHSYNNAAWCVFYVQIELKEV